MAGARSFGSFDVTSHCSRGTVFLCQFRFTECPAEVPIDDWIGICRVGWRSPEKDIVEKRRVRDGELFGRLAMLKVPSTPLPDGQYQYIYVAGNEDVLAFSEPISVGSVPQSPTSSAPTSQSVDSVGLELGNTDGNQGGRQRWMDRCRPAPNFSEIGESDELGQLKEDVTQLYGFVSDMQFKMLTAIERAVQKRENEAEKRTRNVSQLEEQIAGLMLEREELKTEMEAEKTERLRLQEENDRLKEYRFAVRSYVDDPSKSEMRPSNTDSSAMSTVETTAEPEAFPSRSSESIVQGEGESLRSQLNRVPQLYSRDENSSNQRHMTLPPSMPVHPYMEQERASVGSSSGSQTSLQSEQWQRNFRAEYNDRSGSAPVSTSSGSPVIFMASATSKAAAEPGAHLSPEHITQSPESHPPSLLSNILFPPSYQANSSHLLEGVSHQQISSQTSVAQTAHHSLEAVVPELMPEATTGIGASMSRSLDNDFSLHSGQFLTCPICGLGFADSLAGQDALAHHADGHFTN